MYRTYNEVILINNLLSNGLWNLNDAIVGFDDAFHMFPGHGF